MSALFSWLQLKDVSLRNSIAATPICQYRAERGFVNDRHFTHYSSLTRGEPVSSLSERRPYRLKVVSRLAGRASRKPNILKA